MSAFVPNYDEINQLEARVLENRWAAIRYALDHNGEKGSAAEHEVSELIRSFLPSEYGMSTGFIIYHHDEGFLSAPVPPNPQITKQLDIIIYDALKCTPLIRLGACDVVPIEAVYAYVEIKGCLYRNQIAPLIQDSDSLRKLKRRLYYRPKGSTGADMAITGDKNLSIRSFIICLSSEDGLTPEGIRASLEDESRRVGSDAFVSGMLVLGKGFFFSHSVAADDLTDLGNRFRVYLKDKNPLSDLKWCIIESLSRFHRIPPDWTPALDTYSKEYRTNIVYPHASATAAITST